MAQLGYNVSVAQLASMMNTSQDVQAICTSANINKWSKCKPIDYPKTSPLDRGTNEFRGTQDQVGDGIIYGLKAGAAIQRPEELHSATWEYVGRPKGGLGSPYRVDDFWGYEYDYTQGPTLTGAGLNDGDRVRYDTASKVVNLIWRTDLTSIVDLAEVIAAMQHRPADYSKMYLCVMVGTYIRCCINNTAGGSVQPILYNGTKCNNFTIPAIQGTYSYSEDVTRPVTLFFASNIDVDQHLPAMKTSWVDISLSGPNAGFVFDQPLISCPGQVNKQIYFVRQTLQYIAAFSISESRGSISMSIEKGSNWDNASAYRVVWSIKDTSGTNYPLRDRRYTAIDKALEFVPFTLVSDLMADASILAGNRQYNITAQMQYQTGGVWQASEYSSTVTVTY